MEMLFVFTHTHTHTQTKHTIFHPPLNNEPKQKQQQFQVKHEKITLLCMDVMQAEQVVTQMFHLLMRSSET